MRIEMTTTERRHEPDNEGDSLRKASPRKQVKKTQSAWHTSNAQNWRSFGAIDSHERRHTQKCGPRREIFFRKLLSANLWQPIPRWPNELGSLGRAGNSDKTKGGHHPFASI